MMIMTMLAYFAGFNDLACGCVSGYVSMDIA